MKDDVINELVKQLQSYFPDEIADFDLFLPENLPELLSDSAAFGANEISDLATIYNLDAITLAVQWRDLLSELIADPLFLGHKHVGEPVLFWAHYLRNDRKIISWKNKPDIKWVLCVALALPPSIADAERGFSFLTHTKYDRRSSLSAETTRNIMRLRSNGPPLEQFDSNWYAHQWLQERHRTVGDQPRDPKKTTSEEEDIDLAMRSSLY